MVGEGAASTHELFVQRVEAASGGQATLQGLGDADRIPEVEPIGRPRPFELAQAEEHRGESLAVQGPDLFGDRRGYLQLIRDRSEESRQVKAAAARDEHALAAGVRVGDGRAGHVDVLRDGIAFARVDEIQPVMADPPLFFRRRFGRTDVHAAIHADRIARDDLGLVLFRPAQSGLRLADGGRSRQDVDRWRRRRHPARFAQSRQ